MVKVSNEILAAMVVLILAISLTTIFTSFEKMGLIGPLTMTGFQAYGAGTAQVTIQREINIIAKIATVNFGNHYQGDTNVTTALLNTGSPYPFVLENNGTVPVNVTTWATNLWSTPAALNPSVYYRFNGSQNESNSVTSVGNYSAWQNMGLTDPDNNNVVNCLNNSDINDAIFVNINITVPLGEPAASKSSTVSFKAVDGTLTGCGA